MACYVYAVCEIVFFAIYPCATDVVTSSAMAQSITQRLDDALRAGAQHPFYSALALGVSSYCLLAFLNGGRASPTHVADTLKVKSRYRLDNSTSDTMVLADGRTLGYAQYGAPGGRPVIFFHGLPGSRIDGVHFHDVGLRHGIRIIAPDRPGQGWSSPQRHLTFLSHAKDIGALTTHLELEKYAVLGVSGGGPYALACAATLPEEKLKAVGIMCGLGPPNPDAKWKNWMGWLGCVVMLRYLFPLSGLAWMRDLATRVDLPEAERLERFRQRFIKLCPNERDRKMMQDDDFVWLFMRSLSETFSQGTETFAQEAALGCCDFGFGLEDIRLNLPVRLLYGTLDTNVPLASGEKLAVQLGERAHLQVEDETHSGLIVNCKDQFVEELSGWL